MKGRLTRLLTRQWTFLAVVAALLVALLSPGCPDRESAPAVLTADLPLHLEDHLNAATVQGSEVPKDRPKAVEWRFDQPQPDWKPVKPIPAQWEAVKPVRAEDALRLALTGTNRNPGNRRLNGTIYVELPDWSLEKWAYVEIRALTSDHMRNIGLNFNYTEEDPRNPDGLPFYSGGDRAPLITDGTVQTYRLSLDRRGMRSWDGPWTHLAIWFNSRKDAEVATLDILSVSVIPKNVTYADGPVGVKTEVRSEAHRRVLYTHAPGRLEYRIRVPEAGRLDVGLGVLRNDVRVTFRVTVRSDGDEAETLLEETYADKEHWAQRSVDLSGMAGNTVTLALEADAERAGTVALWAAPTLSGARTTDKPNVIFYVIDGAGADFMSVYGYNRRTTPNLERIAAQGAIFERAYSNAAWTKPSTASFMTSLHHSVLGGYKSDSDPLPDQATTMAQHLHRAGYQTAVFTSNPHAGSLSDLQRGVDVFRDKGAENHSASSVELHEDFWKWREEYPGEPFWVHFQTTDVHELQRPVAPFAGLYVAPPSRSNFFAWWRRVWDFGRGWFQDHQTVSGFYRERLEEIGVDPVAFFNTQRGLYDETMAHQDYQLGRLVERLKATGGWENTLLIVASDHGHPAGSFSRFGRELIDPPPPEWEGALFDSYRAHIPMILVWPGHIAPGQRFREQVSMIDMLPTVLDLAGLPMPEVFQGQSLAPLLLGEEGWEPRPVIFEQLQNDSETGEFTGHIEVMDGRWGASLEIYPERATGEAKVRPAGWWRAARPHRPEVPRLLLYDLWNDPYTLHSVNEEHPDLVEKYTKFLEAQWEAHLKLAQRFTPSGDSPLMPEQLQTLRSLGYISED